MAYYVRPGAGGWASVASYLSGGLGQMRNQLQEDARYQDIKAEREADRLWRQDQAKLDQEFRTSQLTMAEEAAEDRRQRDLLEDARATARNLSIGQPVDIPGLKETYGDAFQKVFGSLVGTRREMLPPGSSGVPWSDAALAEPNIWLGDADSRLVADQMAQRYAQAAEATRQFGVTSALSRDRLDVDKSLLELNQAKQLKDELEQKVYSVFNLHAGAVSEAANELANARSDLFNAQVEATTTDDQMESYQSRVTAFEAELARAKSAALAMQEGYAASGTPVPVQAQVLAALGRWRQPSDGMNLNVDPIANLMNGGGGDDTGPPPPSAERITDPELQRLAGVNPLGPFHPDAAEWYRSRAVAENRPTPLAAQWQASDTWRDLASQVETIKRNIAGLWTEDQTTPDDVFTRWQDPDIRARNQAIIEARNRVLNSPVGFPEAIDGRFSGKLTDPEQLIPMRLDRAMEHLGPEAVEMFLGDQFARLPGTGRLMPHTGELLRDYLQGAREWSDVEAALGHRFR